MKGSEFLFENIGQIPDRFVLEADAALSLSGKTAKRSHRKIWRTALIAAAIATLMGATAYAAGFLGFKDHIAPIGEAEVAATTEDGESGEVRRVIKTVPVAVDSPNGLQGSPEYQAAQEWFAFKNEYETQKASAGNEDWEDFDGGFINNERERALAEIYGAWDRTTMDKLLEIAEKYDLQLLTEEKSLIWTEAELCGMSGIKAFIRQDESEFFYAYCFENGSFKAEGALDLNGQEAIYELSRIMEGCLYPYTFYWAMDTEYEEWEYVTSGGQTVDLIATSEPGPEHTREYSMIAFFNRNGAFVELSGAFTVSKDQSVDYRAMAEAMAESFDLDALTAAGGVNEAVWNQWVDKPQPNARRLKTVTTKELGAGCYNGEEGSPEYQASLEWRTFIFDWENSDRCGYDDVDRFANTEREKTLCLVYGDIPDRTSLDKLLEIGEKYNLKLLSEYQHSEVSSDAELCEQRGIEAFLRDPQEMAEIELPVVSWFEDGSFDFEGFRELNGQSISFWVHRIKSGCLYPFDRMVTEFYYQDTKELEKWEYVTSGGQTVAIEVREYDKEETPGAEYLITVSYHRNGVFVTLESTVYKPCTCDYRILAEMLAESVDLEALTA